MDCLISNPDFLYFYLRHRVLDAYLKGNTRARILHADGTYTRLTPEAGREVVDVQEKYMS